MCCTAQFASSRPTTRPCRSAAQASRPPAAGAQGAGAGTGAGACGSAPGAAAPVDAGRLVALEAGLAELRAARVAMLQEHAEALQLLRQDLEARLAERAAETGECEARMNAALQVADGELRAACQDVLVRTFGDARASSKQAPADAESPGTPSTGPKPSSLASRVEDTEGGLRRVERQLERLGEELGERMRGQHQAHAGELEKRAGELDRRAREFDARFKGLQLALDGKADAGHTHDHLVSADGSLTLEL